MRNILGAERSGALPSLIAGCVRLERISDLVKGQLPAPLNRHCHVVNISDDGIMLLHTDAPAWSSRLRLQIPRLVEQLRNHPELGMVRDIRLKTMPSASPSRAVAPARLPELSPAAAAHLRTAAASIETPALRDALLRLASRRR